MYKFVVTLLSYGFAVAAGIFAVAFPPMSLSLGTAVTIWLGVLLILGGALGMIAHAAKLIYLEVLALIPIASGILAYAASAGAIAIATTPSRGLQVMVLLSMVFFIVRYGINLFEQARLQVDKDR